MPAQQLMTERSIETNLPENAQEIPRMFGANEKMIDQFSNQSLADVTARWWPRDTEPRMTPRKPR